MFRTYLPKFYVNNSLLSPSQSSKAMLFTKILYSFLVLSIEPACPAHHNLDFTALTMLGKGKGKVFPVL
jgi:hypothetical protein